MAPSPGPEAEPLALVNDCDHHFQYRIRAGQPIPSIGVCQFCKNIDWDDLADQAAALYAKGRAAGAAPKPATVPDDHPCAYPSCGHPKGAHITGPTWCRHCPASTSDRARPGWHQYTPTKEQP